MLLDLPSLRSRSWVVFQKEVYDGTSNPDRSVVGDVAHRLRTSYANFASGHSDTDRSGRGTLANGYGGAASPARTNRDALTSYPGANSHRITPITYPNRTPQPTCRYAPPQPATIAYYLPYAQYNSAVSFHG